MSHHKNHEQLSKIKESISNSDKLSDSQKSDSVKRIEEWVLENRAFGTLQEELTKISVFFKEIFSELGLK